jgi:hypothetical protein
LIRYLIEPVQSDEPASALGSHVQELAFSGDVPGFRTFRWEGPLANLLRRGATRADMNRNPREGTGLLQDENVGMVAERKPIRPSALARLAQAFRGTRSLSRSKESSEADDGGQHPCGETASTPAGPVPHQKVSKMPDYSELELNYARRLADGLINSGFFRRWFLAETRYAYDYSLAGPIAKSQSSLRSPKMKNPYWFNYWCGKHSDRCSCRIGKAIETDILLVLERDDSRRLALHIEIKRPGEGLRVGQAESYPAGRNAG